MMCPFKITVSLQRLCIYGVNVFVGRLRLSAGNAGAFVEHWLKNSQHFTVERAGFPQYRLLTLTTQYNTL